MNQPGIGSMLHYLSGGSKHNASEFYGRKIVGAELQKADDNQSRWDRGGKDAIVLKFEDGSGVALWDDGQSCCESRYITCDDDLSKIVGGTLTRIEPKETKDIEGEYGDCHEQVFIEIGTDECFVTVCTHNEHNGYYGGFGLTLDVLKP